MKRMTLCSVILMILLMMPDPSVLMGQELFMPLIRTLTVGGINTINCIAYSPDGKTLASGGWNKAIKLWDTQNGYERQTLTWYSRYVVNVTSVAFSPDGKFLASGSEERYNSIKLWDLQTGRELQTLERNTSVYCVTFSPDTRSIAVANPRRESWEPPTVTLWEFKTGNVREILTNHGYISSIAFSPDGNILATGGTIDNTIKLWQVQSGLELQTLNGHSDDVTSVAFSPDGKTVASGSEDKTIKLWEVSSGRELQTLNGHSGDVTSVAFSPDGKTVASGSKDKTIKLWEVLSGRELQTLSGHSDEVLSVAFSPDGKALASGSKDKTIKLWDVSLLDPELAKIYFPLAKEKDAELESIAPLFKPKDEFETDAEYQARLTKANVQKNAIEGRHALKFTELKNKFFQAKELETQNKIRASHTEVSLAIERIGTYDADAETFPITIEGITKDVKIPRAEARSFKEKWQSAIVKGFKQLNRHLVTYEYVDLVIIHPETGNRFPFTLTQVIDNANKSLSQPVPWLKDKVLKQAIIGTWRNKVFFGSGSSLTRILTLNPDGTAESKAISVGSKFPDRQGEIINRGIWDVRADTLLWRDHDTGKQSPAKIKMISPDSSLDVEGLGTFKRAGKKLKQNR